jgi:hypothetical protein
MVNFTFVIDVTLKEMRFFICICFIAFPFLLKGQVSDDISIMDLMRDTQQWNKRDDKMSLTWWIPTEYWRISIKGNPQIPPETIDHIENLFRDYVIVWACDLKINAFGTMTFTKEEDIAKTIAILDINQKKYTPLAEMDIDPEALAIARNMKPIFAQAIGQMGNGLHFFFFKVIGENNSSLINATMPGQFTVLHSNSEFLWKLPLPTLMPPKFCPVDKEKMKGNWVYCPIHGEKL